jgi:hypothetical protein
VNDEKVNSPLTKTKAIKKNPKSMKSSKGAKEDKTRADSAWKMPLRAFADFFRQLPDFKIPRGATIESIPSQMEEFI